MLVRTSIWCEHRASRASVWICLNFSTRTYDTSINACNRQVQCGGIEEREKKQHCFELIVGRCWRWYTICACVPVHGKSIWWKLQAQYKYQIYNHIRIHIRHNSHQSAACWSSRAHISYSFNTKVILLFHFLWRAPPPTTWTGMCVCNVYMSCWCATVRCPIVLICEFSWLLLQFSCFLYRRIRSHAPVQHPQRTNHSTKFNDTFYSIQLWLGASTGIECVMFM